MITIESLKEVCGDFTLDIAGSMSPDKESTDTKSFVLRFHLNGVPLRDVFTRALAYSKITWTNGVGRKNFDRIRAGQVIDVNFSSPAAKIETREEIIAKRMAIGLPKALAEMSVDKPEEFEKLMKAAIDA